MRRLMGALVGLGAVGVLVIALPALATRALSGGRIPTAAQVPTRAVAIILGAQVYPGGTPSPYLAARLDLGAELYKAGTVRVLLVSGDDSPAHHGETSAMRRYLEDRGVPSRHIVEDRHGLDTYDSCVRADRVFGVRDPVLVSQRYHLYRAVATCRLLGMDAVGVGDVSARRVGTFWNFGVARELAANLKMVADLGTRRDPVLGPPSNAVARALAG